MSDSDSISDSDVSQGWTFVGPEGTVDSSDHDSDIVVLKDDEIQVKNLSEVDCTKVKTEFQFGKESQSEARVTNHEADLESKAELCETDFRQKTSSASWDVESQTPETGLVLEERTGVLLSSGEAEVLKMSAEEDQESSSGEIESLVKGLDAENCVEMGNVENAARRQPDDKGSLLNTAGEVAESVSRWELSDLEEISPDSLLNCSCLPSGFMASTLERNTDVSGNDSKSKEEEFSEGDVNADDDDDGDDDDDDDEGEEEDEDDDESVVRKFHEATLLGSFNRNPLHADDRNESQQIIEEDEFLPPDIDDRCESDISGVADDDSDSDLSSFIGIEDLPLHAGDVVRTYRHQPNPKFNKCLTFIAATAMLLAIGIGIGHFIGSTRESSVHQRQLLHLKMLQDEYFVCLRDIEKLESKLVEARDSDTRDKITAVTAVWKKKYEELVLERAELEYKLNQMQDRVKAMLFLKERSEKNARKIENMNEQELSSKLTEQKLETAEPPGTLYGRDLENHKAKGNLNPEDLDQEFKGKLLSANVTPEPVGPASNVPGNVSETHAPISAEETECHKQVDGLKIIVEKKNFEIGLLRNNANHMTVENADLKAAIQNQRYKEHLGNLKQSKEKVAKVKQVDRNMAGAVSHGKRKQKTATDYSEQRRKPNSQFKILNSNQGEKKESIITPKWRQSSISLLKVFTAESLFDSESSTPFNYESIINLTSCFAALQNISTGDHNSLFDFVSSEAFNKEDVVKQIDVLKYRVKKILNLCQNSVNHENSVNERKIKFNKFLKVSMSQQENETLQYHAKFVHKFMKQLRSVVQGFVRSIDSFPKAATAKGDKHKMMKTEMKNWVYRMKSSWKKMEEAVSLIKNQKQQRSSYTRKEPWQMSNVREAEVHGSVLRPVGEKSNQAFDGNRDHKQTESSSSSHQRYEEFWRWNHFDPDDFLQEGFFEDNQREWHKHQKRLRKINGRIQRLTEEILLSMDDDDVEDIYDDIDDFADDVEDREIPEQLRTWLSCQTRWWRSRVYRKHRNEDLVKGCGQQLMHWQLRALCKEKSGTRNRERYDYDRFCKAVISSQGQGLNSRYFAMDASVFRQGAKEDKWKHFSPKTMHAKRFMVDHLMNLSGEYEVENMTFTDHSAYNCDSFSKCHYQSDLPPVKSSYFADLAFGHAATGNEPQYDQSLNCHEDGKLCKLVQDDKQWCEK